MRGVAKTAPLSFAGAIFNSVFYKLSNGLSLKEYHPALENIFMESFHFVMLAGGFIAIIGMITAFLRGPEQTGLKKQRTYPSA